MNKTVQKMFSLQIRKTVDMIEIQEARAKLLQEELSQTNSFLAELRQQRDDLVQFSRDHKIV